MKAPSFTAQRIERLSDLHHHAPAALAHFYGIPAHAPLLPLEVMAAARDVFEHASKRGPSPELVALAERLLKKGP
jgi:hypothetical protein